MATNMMVAPLVTAPIASLTTCTACASYHIGFLHLCLCYDFLTYRLVGAPVRPLTRQVVARPSIYLCAS